MLNFKKYKIQSRKTIFKLLAFFLIAAIILLVSQNNSNFDSSDYLEPSKHLENKEILIKDHINDSNNFTLKNAENSTSYKKKRKNLNKVSFADIEYYELHIEDFLHKVIKPQDSYLQENIIFKQLLKFKIFENFIKNIYSDKVDKNFDYIKNKDFKKNFTKKHHNSPLAKKVKDIIGDLNYNFLKNASKLEGHQKTKDIVSYNLLFAINSNFFASFLPYIIFEKDLLENNNKNKNNKLFIKFFEKTKNPEEIIINRLADRIARHTENIKLYPQHIKHYIDQIQKCKQQLKTRQDPLEIKNLDNTIEQYSKKLSKHMHSLIINSNKLPQNKQDLEKYKTNKIVFSFTENEASIPQIDLTSYASKLLEKKLLKYKNTKDSVPKKSMILALTGIIKEHIDHKYKNDENYKILDKNTTKIANAIFK